MYELISNLILYGNLPEDEILVQLAKLLSDDEKSNHELRQEIYGQIKRLLELATQYGFNDNLWHNYLTYLLMTNENPFSMTCEKQGAKEGTVNHFALNDFKVFYDLFHYDFRSIEKELNIDCFGRCSHWLRRLCFVYLPFGKVFLKGFFHFFRGKPSYHTNAVVIDVH